MGKTFETVNRGVMIALLLLGLLALTANGQCNINNLCANSGLDRCVPSGATCASTFSGGFSTITLTVPAGLFALSATMTFFEFAGAIAPVGSTCRPAWLSL